MRFRAIIKNPFILTKLLQALTPTKKDGFLKLNSKRCLIYQNEKIEVWTEIETDAVFSDFRIQSNQENNNIWLELDMSLALKALQSCGNDPQQVVLRLTKKNNRPYLSIETRCPTSSNFIDQQIEVKQDIPCRVLPSGADAQLKTPVIQSEPRVRIFLPPIKEVKPVVDRIAKSMADYITLSATMAKTLTFRADTSSLWLSTFFKNLQHPQPERPLDPNVKEEAKIMTKYFAKVLSVHVLPQIEICLSFAENCLLFHVLPENNQGSFFISFYVPLEAS